MLLAFDIGGTFIKYGIMNGDEIITKGKVPTPSGPEIIQALTEVADEIMKKYNCQGITISSAGQVDYEAVTIVGATPNFDDYAGTDFCSLGRKFGVKVALENDATCAMLASDLQDGMFVVVGTGIGGALMSNGQVFRGYNGREMDIGAITYLDGTFETYNSASKMTNDLSKLLNCEVDGFMINKLHKENNAIVKDYLEQYYHHFAVNLKSLISVLDPKEIVIGGGISEADFFDVQNIENKIYDLFNDECEIKLSKINVGNDAALIGARRYFDSLYKNN